MILRAIVVIFICAVWWPSYATAEAPGNVTNGEYPYVGYVFYADEAGKAATMIRLALLVSPTHLVSASIDANDEHRGFPKRTLMVRLGATKIGTREKLDSAEEQEQEVIEIIRPYNHTASQAWLSDITLLRVENPFSLTQTVNITKYNTSPRLYTDHICTIVLFLKSGDSTSDYHMRKVEVKMMPQSTCKNSAKHFAKERLLCSSDVKDVDEDYCRINSGGPLICDEVSLGFQSYMKDETCAGPVHYQRFHYWDKFISCGVKEEFNKDCDMIGVPTYKDPSFNPNYKDPNANKTTSTEKITEAPTTVSVLTTNKEEEQHPVAEVKTTQVVIEITEKKETEKFETEKVETEKVETEKVEKEIVENELLDAPLPPPIKSNETIKVRRRSFNGDIKIKCGASVLFFNIIAVAIGLD